MPRIILLRRYYSKARGRESVALASIKTSNVQHLNRRTNYAKREDNLDVVDSSLSYGYFM